MTPLTAAHAAADQARIRTARIRDGANAAPVIDKADAAPSAHAAPCRRSRAKRRHQISEICQGPDAVRGPPPGTAAVGPGDIMSGFGRSALIAGAPRHSVAYSASTVTTSLPCLPCLPSLPSNSLILRIFCAILLDAGRCLA